MAHRNFRELGMDTMERLYYERKDFRKKRYETKKKNKPSTKSRISAKRHQMEQDSRAFDRAVHETLDHQIEAVC